MAAQSPLPLSNISLCSSSYVKYFGGCTPSNKTPLHNTPACQISIVNLSCHALDQWYHWSPCRMAGGEVNDDESSRKREREGETTKLLSILPQRQSTYNCELVQKTTLSASSFTSEPQAKLVIENGNFFQFLFYSLTRAKKLKKAMTTHTRTNEKQKPNVWTT